MGCGESKHAVATTEPIKSTSRSSSRRIENPEQNTTTTTTTITTTASSVSETRNGFSEAIDGNKKDGEKTVGVIPGEPFVYQKPPMEATKRGAVVKEGKKKLVVVVAHDRTASKESQVSDYFSEDGIEEKSEYESPQPDEERGSNLAVVALQGYKKIQSGRHGKQGKTEEEMKQEQIEQVKTEEGVSQRQDDQVVVAKQDVQETKITQVEHGTTMAAEDKGEQDRSNDTIVVTTTAKQETKIMEIDEVKPTELVVRTIAEEKIKDTDA